MLPVLTKGFELLLKGILELLKEKQLAHRQRYALALWGSCLELLESLLVLFTAERRAFTAAAAEMPMASSTAKLNSP